MLVVVPTAIPFVPLINTFGTFAGNEEGSSFELSKLGTKSTVFLLKSDKNTSSVYLSSFAI